MKDRWEHNGVVYVDAHEYIDELERENKNLKNDLADQYDGANGLHDEIGYRKRRCKELEAIIEHWKKYEEGIQKLKLWKLDNEDVK